MAVWCLVLLSEAYVASETCESQLTYAKDTGREILYLALDSLGFNHVMATSSRTMSRTSSSSPSPGGDQAQERSSAPSHTEIDGAARWEAEAERWKAEARRKEAEVEELRRALMALELRAAGGRTQSL